ncbi:MAG: hypothetical protein GY906_36980 [bacterium]|nr:hypothetical protein [bacterium]
MGLRRARKGSDQGRSIRPDLVSYEIDIKAKAHAAFDRLWGTQIGRAKAYHWLARKLCIGFVDCHISYFDDDQCKEVMRISDEAFKEGTFFG